MAGILGKNYHGRNLDILVKNAQLGLMVLQLDHAQRSVQHLFEGSKYTQVWDDTSLFLTSH